MRKKFFHQMYIHRQLYLFLFFPLVYLIIFHYIPMSGVQIAFRKYSAALGFWNSPWVGFAYFKRFFSSYMCLRVIRNTVSLSLYSLAVGFPIPIIFALCLNVMGNPKYKKTVQLVSYAPHFISTTVLVGMINSLLSSRTGMYGAVYKALFDTFPADLFSTASSFLHMYVWSGVWQNIGWSSIIYLAALSSVDIQLHEAAKIDGASHFSRVLHIDLPHILPTASIMLILAAGRIMTIGFEKVFLMQNSVNITFSETISTYVYKVGLQNSPDFSYSTAIGFFNSLINLSLLILVNGVTRKLSNTSLF